jgi:hypothetical protein
MSITENIIKGGEINQSKEKTTEFIKERDLLSVGSDNSMNDE